MDSATVPHQNLSASYEPRRIEQKWQGSWCEQRAFATPEAIDGRRDAYIFVAPPFTSGNIHMGHVRSYALGDASARFRRARGEAVLFALGFDAFGLPAELGAIDHGLAPSEWVDHCRRAMRFQLDELGYSFDWSRTFSTHEPDVYRWSQWLFLALLEDGLIYRHKGPVDWCDKCHTSLARAQVQNGNCWRCNDSVSISYRSQWYLRLSAYNEESSGRISELAGWSRTAIAAQEAMLGQIDGVEVDTYAMDGTPLAVFTPHRDALGQAEFVALSPNYPEIQRWVGYGEDGRQLESASIKVRRDQVANEPVVVATGLSVQMPETKDLLPVVISPYVDARFGATAVLGIPARDKTDRKIAAKIKASSGLMWRPDGRQSLVVRPAVRYRAADFPVSRQRGWGTPIPIVYCEGCGTVPVPFEQLPVVLPHDLPGVNAGNSLATHETFAQCACPSCGTDARRETDTLDCHMDITWIEMPLAVQRDQRTQAMFNHPELARWLPVGQFVHGVDTGGFVLTQRMVAKALRDRGLLSFLASGEPYGPSMMHEMVMQGGHKMSKHLGNSIEPRVLVEQFGADSVRFAILYAASPEKSFNWDENIAVHCHRFLKQLWDYAESRLRVVDTRNPQIDISDRLRQRLANWCDTATEKITNNFETLAMQRATRNIMLLLTRIEDFEKRKITERGVLEERDEYALAVALALLLQFVAPIAPHIAEELWERCKSGDSIEACEWPAAKLATGPEAAGC
jgi:leucyl-tRNA synthetase